MQIYNIFIIVNAISQFCSRLKDIKEKQQLNKTLDSEFDFTIKDIIGKISKI